MPTRPNRAPEPDDGDGADDGDDEIELPEAMSDADYAEFLASDPLLAAARDPVGDGPSDAVLRRRRRALYAIVLALLLAFGAGLLALL